MREPVTTRMSSIRRRRCEGATVESIGKTSSTEERDHGSRNIPTVIARIFVKNVVGNDCRNGFWTNPNLAQSLEPAIWRAFVGTGTLIRPSRGPMGTTKSVIASNARRSTKDATLFCIFAAHCVNPRNGHWVFLGCAINICHSNLLWSRDDESSLGPMLDLRIHLCTGGHNNTIHWTASSACRRR